MVGSVQFAVQQYQAAEGGKWTRGLLTQCRSAEEAQRFAERCVMLGKSSGAAAFSAQIADDFEDPESLVTIAAYGEVPENGQDVLQF